MKKLTCFKAYDIRGKLGEELNEDINGDYISTHGKNNVTI